MPIPVGANGFDRAGPAAIPHPRPPSCRSPRTIRRCGSAASRPPLPGANRIATGRRSSRGHAQGDHGICQRAQRSCPPQRPVRQPLSCCSIARSMAPFALHGRTPNIRRNPVRSSLTAESSVGLGNPALRWILANAAAPRPARPPRVPAPGHRRRHTPPARYRTRRRRRSGSTEPRPGLPARPAPGAERTIRPTRGCGWRNCPGCCPAPNAAGSARRRRRTPACCAATQPEPGRRAPAPPPAGRVSASVASPVRAASRRRFPTAWLARTATIELADPTLQVEKPHKAGQNPPRTRTSPPPTACRRSEGS
jgi:hypothetical protein